ncbi:MAG: hypothetical protein ACRBK7_08930 [Acidimicrobiales bacterium]
MDLPLFDHVADVVRSLTPEELGELKLQAHRRGIKAWFDTEKAPREHYEAQLLARRHVDGRDGMALEIGFHAENRDTESNVAAIELIGKTEKKWRKILGADAEVGEFYGASNWRRVSEAWIEPDLEDPEVAFEVASRLVDYLEAIEPARHR